jgi:cytochrome c oxidase subunit II
MKVVIAGVGLGLVLAASPGEAQERELMLADGQQVFIDNGCFACHSVAGSGGAIGPDLSHVGTRFDQDTLTGWLRDPAQHGLSAHAQKFRRLTRGQVEQLAAYLSSLR